MCRYRSVTGRRAFPPGYIPGSEWTHRIARYQFRRQYFVLRFSVFLFFGACRRGRHRVGSGLPVPGQRKSGNTLAFSPHALLQREYSRQTGKSPGTACSPLRAPCAQGSGTFCAMDTGSRPVDNSPCRYIQFRGTRKPGIQYAYRSPSVMCPPDYPFRQAVPARLTRKYCQAEKIILLG